MRSETASWLSLDPNETRCFMSQPDARLYGYARVSTTDQHLTVQREALIRAGCTTIREEKITGTTTEGRKELRILMDFVRSGDTLVVTRIARSP